MSEHLSSLLISHHLTFPHPLIPSNKLSSGLDSKMYCIIVQCNACTFYILFVWLSILSKPKQELDYWDIRNPTHPSLTQLKSTQLYMTQPSQPNLIQHNPSWYNFNSNQPNFAPCQRKYSKQPLLAISKNVAKICSFWTFPPLPNNISNFIQLPWDKSIGTPQLILLGHFFTPWHCTLW